MKIKLKRGLAIRKIISKYQGIKTRKESGELTFFGSIIDCA